MNSVINDLTNCNNNKLQIYYQIDAITKTMSEEMFYWLKNV